MTKFNKELYEKRQDAVRKCVNDIDWAIDQMKAHGGHSEIWISISEAVQSYADEVEKRYKQAYEVCSDFIMEYIEQGAVSEGYANDILEEAETFIFGEKDEE